MKTIVIILDLIVCCFLIFTAIFEYGADYLLEMITLFLLTILTILNIYLIYFKSDKSWLGLYFKRKALEEKKKIDKLNENKG